MPLPIAWRTGGQELADVRKSETDPVSAPDGKTQVSVRYRDGRPVAIEKRLISTQHIDGAEGALRRPREHVGAEPPVDLYDAEQLRAGSS